MLNKNILISALFSLTFYTLCGLYGVMAQPIISWDELSRQAIEIQMAHIDDQIHRMTNHNSLEPIPVCHSHSSAMILKEDLKEIMAQNKDHQDWMTFVFMNFADLDEYMRTSPGSTPKGVWQWYDEVYNVPSKIFNISIPKRYKESKAFLDLNNPYIVGHRKGVQRAPEKLRQAAGEPLKTQQYAHFLEETNKKAHSYVHELDNMGKLEPIASPMGRRDQEDLQKNTEKRVAKFLTTFQNDQKDALKQIHDRWGQTYAHLVPSPKKYPAFPQTFQQPIAATTTWQKLCHWLGKACPWTGHEADLSGVKNGSKGCAGNNLDDRPSGQFLKMPPLSRPINPIDLGQSFITSHQHMTGIGIIFHSITPINRIELG